MSCFDEECIVGGVRLSNAFIMESGPFGHSGESIAACTKAGFAAVSTETISLINGRSPWWNIWRDGDNLYNCSKWSDISLEDWIKKEFPYALSKNSTVIATIGHTSEDMAIIAPRLAETGIVAIKACTYRADQIVSLVREAKKRTKLPVWAKISANWPNYKELARQCELEGADALVAIDTIGPVKWIQNNGNNALGVKGSCGWMSGACIHAKALQVISDLSVFTKLPIIGVGGILDADRVLRAKEAGASAFGLCSTVLMNGLGQLRKI